MTNITHEFSLKLFIYVVAIAATIIGVYDAYVCLKLGPRFTITHAVRVLSFSYPWLKFLTVAIAGWVFGFFTCHFFAVD